MFVQGNEFGVKCTRANANVRLRTPYSRAVGHAYNGRNGIVA